MVLIRSYIESNLERDVIEGIWFQKSIWFYLFSPFLWPLSKLYQLLSARRKKRYAAGDLPTYRATKPVIVVGNITAGGNGKTPVVLWLVEYFQSQGLRVGVVSRGYGGKSNRYPLLVDDTVLAQECGDEPKLIATRTGATVAVSPNRVQAIQAIEQLVDVIVSDDGMQHYAMLRDMEIAVVDGVRRYGNGHHIPLGPLRESQSRLDDVDIIINNGSTPMSGELAMELEPEDAINLNSKRRKPVSELGRINAFAGIGHPPRFLTTLQALGANIENFYPFADHQAYTKEEIEPLQRGADNVLMTEKDAVKCQNLHGDCWWYLPVSCKFRSQDQRQLTTKLQEVLKSHGS